MKKKVFGIDIGTYSIKISEIEESLNEFDLVSFYEHPVVYNDVLSHAEAQSATLQKMVEDYHIEGGIAYTSFPGELTATRLLDLPFGAARKIDQTLEFEMEDYSPLPLEDIQIDYHILQSSKTESKCLISYAKKADIVKFLNIFSGADIEPRFIGCESVELSNVMKLGMIQPEGAYAILDLGHSKSNIALMVGDNLHYSRSLSLGGFHITQAIAAKLRVPLDEAEKFKQEIGQVAGEAQDDMTRKVNEAISDVLGQMMIEIKQTFASLHENEGHIVQAIYLCGGTARLSGIDHFFSLALRKNVSFLECLDFPFNKLSDSTWCRLTIPQSLALAFRATGMARLPDINFRRGEFLYEGDFDQLGAVAKQLGVMVALIVTVVGISFGVNYFTLGRQVEDLKKSVTAVASRALPAASSKMLESPDSVLSMINGKILEVSEYKSELEESVNLSTLEILREISNVLPKRDALKLDVDELQIAGDRIRFEGRADNFESVDTIKLAISKSALFSNVSTGNVKKGAGNFVKFTMSMQVASEKEEDDYQASRL
jgi:type IV pilus assembly protein PilM